MLLLIAVLAIVSAAFLLFRFAKRHDSGPLAQIPISNEPPVNARPLFAPSDEELRLETIQKEARAIAAREYHSKTKARAVIDEALDLWHARPNRTSAAELLRAAAENGLDGDFARAATEVIEYSAESGIDALTSSDLAELINSHIDILSQSERSSGEIFWLNQEVARLRTDDVDTG